MPSNCGASSLPMDPAFAEGLGVDFFFAAAWLEGFGFAFLAGICWGTRERMLATSPAPPGALAWRQASVVTMAISGPVD